MKRDPHYLGFYGWLAAFGPVAIAVASWILWAVSS